MNRLLCGVLLIIALFAIPTMATESYFNYLNYRNLTAELKILNSTFPDLVQLGSLGQTLDKREVWMITLGAGVDSDKPALLIVAGVEAPEVASTSILSRFIKTVAANYGQVDSVTQFLDRYSFYIVPRLNPDA